MENLIKNSRNLIKSVALDKKRYLRDKIDFSEKMIGIVGQRGTGKTTLILQFLKEQDTKDESVYISADDIYFLENSLKNTVETLYHDYGFRTFAIDEIHKYKNWNQELKNIYDLLPDIRILFSGSSSLEVAGGAYDLSRRALVHELYGLSFREFIEFKTGERFMPFSFTELLDNYKVYSVKISSKLDLPALFGEYLKGGYFPYFLKSTKAAYYSKYENALNKTIYEDIANLYNIKTEHLHFFKRILNFLASIPPGEININRLSSSLGAAFETTEFYVGIMRQVSLIRFLLKDSGGHKLIRKAEKIFLDNTNMVSYIDLKLGLEQSGGYVRELFVLNQMQNAGEKIFAAGKNGDFFVKNGSEKIILEIGGKSKNARQIAKIENSFLALDNILIGDKNKIPLYLFGFLY